MLEKIMGLEKMSILQGQELAKDIGFNSATFNLCGPKGKIPCKWLDAYFGMFCTEDDPDHFMMVKEFKFNPDVWCTDLKSTLCEEQKC